MDWLSQLFGMMAVTGQLDRRCLYGTPWRIDQAAAGPGGIAYHAPLAGCAIVEDPFGGPHHRLETGDILLVPAGVAHSLWDGGNAPPSPSRDREGLNVLLSENAGSGERLDLLCGHFYTSRHHNRLLRDYLPPLLIIRGQGRMAAAGRGLTDPHIRGLLALMRSETEDEGLGGRALLNALSTALFALALRLGSETVSASTGLLALAANPQLTPALAAMFEAPGRGWTLSKLAGLCHMSRATFVRNFQLKVGRSAATFLTDLRMTLAAGELRKPSGSVATVSLAVGYRSEAAFQRAFRRKMGVTPAQWRRAGQGDAG